MSEVTGVTSSDFYNSVNPAKETEDASNELGQNEFFELLVAQLNNQNPLDPAPNGEFIAQLAQFSTTTGIQGMQESMESLLSSLEASQSMQATSLIGHHVMTDGNAITLDDGEAKGAFALASAADTVVVQVKNSAGLVVDELSLGASTGGMQEFTWDGLDDNGEAFQSGQYYFSVQALSSGLSIEAQTYSLNKVSSVLFESGQATLELADGSSVGLSDVQRVI